jgi:hypothetical protein
MAAVKQTYFCVVMDGYCVRMMIQNTEGTVLWPVVLGVYICLICRYV